MAASAVYTSGDPWEGSAPFDLNYQRASRAKKRKRHAFDEESVDDVHMTIFHGCDERG